MRKISAIFLSVFIFALFLVSANARSHELGCKGEVELSELIVMFMLDDGGSPSWRMQANNELICWLTEGIENRSAIAATREGEIFVHVMGRRYSVLKRRLESLPWVVKLANPGNAKFPPDWVFIGPKMDCFGADGTGCDFTLLPSLEAGGFSYELLCENNEILTSTTALYHVSYPGKQDAYLAYDFSSGSGGETNSLRLYWNMDSARFYACKEGASDIYDF